MDLEDLAARHDRLQRLFQANPVPLFVLDAHGDVILCNRRARHTVGRSAASLDRCPFVDLVDPSWRASTARRLEQARQNGARHAADTGLLTTDGKTLFARVEIIPVDEPGGRLLQVAVLVLTEDSANLRLVGDTFDTTRDRVRAASADYDRS